MQLTYKQILKEIDSTVIAAKMLGYEIDESEGTLWFKKDDNRIGITGASEKQVYLLFDKFRNMSVCHKIRDLEKVLINLL